MLRCCPRSYTADAVVMLDQRKNNVTDQSQMLADLPTDAASLQNQIQILTSRDLAAEVIGKEKLYDDPEFNPALNDNPFGACGPSAASHRNGFHPAHRLRADATPLSMRCCAIWCAARKGFPPRSP